MDDLDQELDRLYALEPGAFVAERDRLARELRQADRREEAEQVKQLRKPSVSAWAINQLSRRERRDVDLLLDAGHRLREAQQGLLAGEDPASFDEARRTERDALAALRRAAGRILAEAGRESDATLNRIAGTLQAAAISEEGRELLARGRFTADLEVTGFELLTPVAEGRRPKAPAARRGQTRAAPKRAPEVDRKRVEEARRRLRDAKAAAKDAQRDLSAAERDVTKARRDLAAVEERLRKSQDAAAGAKTAVERAETELREAQQKAP
jgi:hypothetical protein